jgi:toxin-antitoxin system PIN domain toxin
MKVVDANVLLYAVNQRSERHEACRSWLAAALSGSETIGLPWVSLLAFLRISTNPRILPSPLTITEASALTESWLAQPPALALSPSPRHIHLLAGLLRTTGAAGNLVTDAHIAALAVEHDATVVTLDRDVERFGVSVLIPS